jgi:hypothetical protein
MNAIGGPQPTPAAAMILLARSGDVPFATSRWAASLVAIETELLTVLMTEMRMMVASTLPSAWGYWCSGLPQK